MEYNADNVFAKILRKEIKTDFIYEDDYAVAFYDINPKAKVHVLVISKAMLVNFSDFISHSSDEEIAGYMRAIQHVVSMLKLEEKGYRIVFNTNENGGQEVPHLHAHILGGEKLKTSL